MHILCTFPARAMCSPDQLLILRCDDPVHLCHCAEFGIANSKFHKLRGSTLIKLSPSGTCFLCRPAPVTTMARAPPPTPRKAEPCKSIDLGFSLEKTKRVQILSMRSARAIYTPDQHFMRHRHHTVQLCPSDEFGIAGLKIKKLE